ncbi:HIT family protein [Flavobacterium sp. 7A]|uniref:HIT family protein n=1 Tax=Flavobacterium sp. 7A TaxID=2940571 RepID=UPI002225C411|nr:HIT family protein [Flavobacterium sp. 7A]MCW2118108.1 histidine triad (HIT) family protein [Flavobacterium sp. 7A]
MSSIFTKIIKGEIPCYKIAENDDYFAFLDVNPNTKGHTLCIPKVEVDKLFDLDEEHYMGLMHFSRKVALAIEKTIPCNRIGLSVIGLEVPHAHVHLVPISNMEDMRFISKVKMTKEEFESLAAAIRSNL